MTSATLSVVSLSVALIVGREKLHSFVKDHKKKILVVLCVGAIVALSISGLLGAFWKWFLHPVPVPVWALTLEGLTLAMFATAAFVLWLRSLPEIPKPPNGKPVNVMDYTEDIIFGVLWRWGYTGYLNDGYVLDGKRLTAFCPVLECGNQLSVKDELHRMPRGSLGPIPVSLVCPRCHFKHDYEMHEGLLTQRVAEEVQRLINTGQFKGKVRAMREREQELRKLSNV
jgi:hypothetical protein